MMAAFMLPSMLQGFISPTGSGALPPSQGQVRGSGAMAAVSSGVMTGMVGGMLSTALGDAVRKGLGGLGNQAKGALSDKAIDRILGRGPGGIQGAAQARLTQGGAQGWMGRQTTQLLAGRTGTGAAATGVRGAAGMVARQGVGMGIKLFLILAGQ